LTIHVRLRSDIDAAATAREALDAFQQEVPQAVLEDARILVSELVTNSVRHGSPAPDGSIELLAERRAGVLRLEVIDAGGRTFPEVQPRDPGRPSGWGLYLVERLAKRWGASTGSGTRVWCELALD
jgi:serine/threonine-protein kinase RsbW